MCSAKKRFNESYPFFEIGTVQRHLNEFRPAIIDNDFDILAFMKRT